MNNLNSHHNLKQGVIAWFVCNPVAANLLMLITLVVGLFSFSKLQIQGFPSIEANTVSIEVIYNSGSAKQSEEGIAIKIEEALQGLAGIREIRSNSTTDGATITVEKHSDYSLALLNEEITNKVNAIHGLPLGSEKPIITKQKDEEHALWFDVYGNVEQQVLLKFSQQFKQALLQLPSINKVDESGWKKPEISIEIDENQLQALDLTLAGIANVIAAESLNETSGQLRSKDGLILLKADKQRYFEQEFAEIVVKTNRDGSTIKLSDVATINDSFEESPNVLSRFQGKPAISYQVMVGDGKNILTIAEQAKTLALQWKEQGRLPIGVEISVLWDQSQFMTERLMLLASNGIVGIILVMLTLAIFLNLKVAFWVGMGLPICFSGAFILMGDGMFSLSINELTTFGFIIVLGILVDDAVVVGESVYATKEREGNTIDATIIGVKRIAVPTMFGVLTTIAAFYPMSYISGDLGKIFSQFALVAVACLIFSLIESKLILPAHLAHLNIKQKPSQNILMRFVQRVQARANGLMITINLKIYQPAIHLFLKYRYVALSVFISLFILVVGLIPSGRVGFVFFPDIPRDIIEINYSAEQNSGYGVSHEQARLIEGTISKLNEQWLLEYPNSEPVFNSIQVQVLDDINGNVTLELSTSSGRQVSLQKIEEKLRENLFQLEGIRELQVLTDTISIDSFSLKLLADSRDDLYDASEQIIAFLAQTEGVSDIKSDLVKGLHQIEFELTPSGRALGLTTADLASQISQAFYGAEVQRVQRGKDEVKVFVRYPAEQRKDITNLQNARIRTASGQVVPLTSVANKKSVYTIKDINHVNGRNAVTISAKINKSVTSPDDVMEYLLATKLVEIKSRLPSVDYKIAGESAEEEETIGSMMKVFGLSLFLIYILTAIPLKSYLQPLIIMAAIPFGILGAILGHWFIGIPISILSLLGVIALSGVVVNNSLLIVSYYNELREQGDDIYHAISQACGQRLRAILLTSITTYAGLASLLQETSEQAAYLIPAAASLAYGILFSTTITLILVPILLMIFNDVNIALSKLIFGKRDRLAEVNQFK